MKKNKKSHKTKSFFSKFLSKFMVLIIIMLLVLILLKIYPDLESKIFNTNINLSGLNTLYTKYFGDILPIKKESSSSTVSKETIKYSKAKKYKDGVNLTVSNEYTVVSQNAGLVIFKGEKENYGNTVVIQRPDGIEIWYGNLKNINVSLYDYIKQGQILGSVNGTNLYMVFVKNGEFLNYKKYI